MSIPIISINRLYRVVLLTSALLFGAAIVTILIVTDHKLIPYFAIGGVIVGLATWFLKAYDVKGAIVLSEDTIIINGQEGEQLYHLDQVESMILINNDFEGDFVGARSFATKKGVNNRLEFKCRGKAYSFRILLKREYITPLNKVLGEWRAKNYDFVIYNSYGKKVEKLS